MRYAVENRRAPSYVTGDLVGASYFTNTSEDPLETSMGELIDPGQSVAVVAQTRITTGTSRYAWSALLLELLASEEGVDRGVVLDTCRESGKQLLTFMGLTPPPPSQLTLRRATLRSHTSTPVRAQ